VGGVHCPEEAKEVALAKATIIGDAWNGRERNNLRKKKKGRRERENARESPGITPEQRRVA